MAYLRCPHCGCRANVRSSSRETDLTTAIYLQCSNLECSHSFKALTEIVGTISPSAMPRPDIVLPMLRRQPKNS